MPRDRLLDELRVNLGLLERLRGQAGSADEPDDIDLGEDHPLDAVETGSPDDAVASSDATAAYGPVPEAATDGGSEWTGDDPISFDADADGDGASVLDAVTFDPHPDEAGADGESASGDEADVDPASVEAGANPVNGEDAALDEPTGAADPATDADLDVDVDLDEDDDPREAGAPDGETNHDVDELEDRVESMEDQQAAVAANVEALESDVRGLHGEVRTVRSDLETLVDLVKEAAPTRGGAAAEPVADPDDEPAGERPSAGDTDGADAPADDAAETSASSGDGTATRGDGTAPDRDETTSRGDGTAESVAARAAETVERAADSADRSASAASTDRSAADPRSADSSVAHPRSADRSVADPRSDAAEERLRSFREEFEDGPQRSVEHDDADGDESDATAFEFTKVLYPPETDEGAPEVVGDIEKPYLEALPEGFEAEAAVIEWLDGIVARTDESTTVQAVEFYASIGWITPSVRDTLVDYVEGVGDVEPADGPTAPPADLGLEDHRRSLEYVTMLATGEVSTDGL